MRGVILAGGHATRFGGQPKGLLAVGGRRVLDRVMEACTTAFVVPPLVVANDPSAATWAPHLDVVPDLLPDAGPLGGLLTAIECGPAPVVVVAWDMPFVTAPLLRALADGLAGADLCLPASPGRRGVEPLCAAYGAACGPAIRASLAAGAREAIAFHASVRVRVLPLDVIAAFGDPRHLFDNVNTPDDLHRANRADAPA